MKQEDFLKKNHIMFLEMDLDSYEKYISFTEDYLDNTAEEYQKKHLDSLKDDTIDWEITKEYKEKMFEVDGNFAQRFRESIIVQLYSFFERALLNSCEMYNSNKEMNENYFNGIGSKAGFEEAKIFLKKKAIITLNDLNPELDFFSKLSTLRNRIVHHKTAHFYDEEKKINDIRALSKNWYIFQEKNNFLTTYFIHFDKPEFSFEIINKIKTFYRKLGEKEVYYL
jgi:hypothetical protein